ncbi:potassium/proton antiporter [Conexibacter sp. JD483]|uniref:potassium/proton antiporter n=1 Tax=unclassified Conexibacter TaxID=2627773 RepID=UPI002722BF0B|nr:MULTISPECIES: potassium/proton antiporter [unclassified Conexibacter]MDO8184320.1 potassium/proton antiporter [Conexibacter sp. CPCC 205706]MDO8197626.1 potassium/proton antiporter [Conexibacter sp. CPCC 205762]MDR9369619.1 potassium/proton antiporter [Conexibacter sp. JD483]
MADGHLILIAGALLFAGIAASLLAGRLRLPSLVLFLGIGMAVGSDGLGWVDFSNYEMAREIGIIALALILFEGGLTAGFGEIRPVLRNVVSLALFGTLITAAICGLAASWLFGFTLLEGLLLGAIVSSTDGAAIFALLRGSSLKRKLGRTLEGEAGMNDPIAVLLVVGFIDWIEKPDYGIVDMLWLFVTEVGIGVAIGAAVGLGAVQLFQRAQLATPGLYPVASIAAAALSFGAADALHGSGFLAVYLTGLALGSAHIPAKHTITSFHQGLAWVAQLTMFLVLGLLVFPSQFGDIWLEGTVLALVLAFVARPIAAYVAAGPGFSFADRTVLGWAGLRGAVPVVLATFPVLAGVHNSSDFFDIVFFAVLLSTVLQGSSFEALARRLGATAAAPSLTTSALSETGTIRSLGADSVEYAVAHDDAIVGLRIRDLELPRAAVVNLIVRDEQAVPPRGSTRVRAGDMLHVLIRREALPVMRELTDRWHSGPIGPRPRPKRIPEGHAPVFHVRPWSSADDGDPNRAETVAGRMVVDRLRTRRDVPGALVLLDDGYFAVTGPVLALGREQLLSQWVRRKARAAPTDAERSWWEEVLGALAL